MQSNFSLKVFTLLEILKERSENSLFSFAKVEHASLFLLRAYKDIPSFSNCADAFEPLGNFLYPAAKFCAAWI